MSVAQVDRLPARELVAWSMFEEDFGPLTLHERTDGIIQALTGEKPVWKTVRPLTDDILWSWLGAMAQAPRTR